MSRVHMEPNGSDRSSLGEVMDSAAVEDFNDQQFDYIKGRCCIIDLYIYTHVYIYMYQCMHSSCSWDRPEMRTLSEHCCQNKRYQTETGIPSNYGM